MTILEFMSKLGIPTKDLSELRPSGLTFPDGADYRIEISGIEHPSVFEALVDEMEKYKLRVHRVDQALGTMFLTDDELQDMVRIARENRIEFVTMVSPRASHDVGMTLRTVEGLRAGVRVRGATNLSYHLAEISRAIDFGVKGFLLTDEGVLWVLDII
jgi:hypothetical protein